MRKSRQFRGMLTFLPSLKKNLTLLSAYPHSSHLSNGGMFSRKGAAHSKRSSLGE